MERHFPGAQTVPRLFQARHLRVGLALLLLLLFDCPSGLQGFDFFVNTVHSFVLRAWR
jgi:hypothetical protein